MKLDRRVVAVAAVAALTFGMPSAAHAGSAGKGKAVAAQQQKAAKAKAEAARKKAEAARKKAEQAKHEAVPGTVTAVGSDSITVARKKHGATVSRTLSVASDAVVKLDGARITLAQVQVGDHVVAHVRSVGGALKVVKLNVARKVAPTPPATSTATIGILL